MAESGAIYVNSTVMGWSGFGEVIQAGA